VALAVVFVDSLGLPDENLVVGGILRISTEVFASKLEEASTGHQGGGVHHEH
jgi:hypothetical protein